MTHLKNNEVMLTKHHQEQLEVFVQLKSGIITNAEAAIRLGLTIRQVQRKKKKFIEDGAASLIHKSTGRKPNNAYSDDFKKKIVEIYRSEYFGWNFSHFRDALEDDCGIEVSETLIYNLLTTHGFKSPRRKRRRKDKTHPPRPRRENAGELIQVDASKHQWLYGDQKYYYLHGGIDDATGIVTSCFLMEQETTLGYQIIMRDTIQKYGIPEALYTDYRTVFQSNLRLTLDDTLKGKRPDATKFTKMLKRLGVDLFSTEDPRAKGRIERLWGTLQDRLVKEIYKRKISTIDAANEYIAKDFLPKFNHRFAIGIDPEKNHFVKVSPSFNYNRELALCYSHKVLDNCYIKHKSKYYEIKKYGMSAKIRTRESVSVFQGINGKLYLEHKHEWYDLEEIVRVAKEKPKPKKLTSEELSEIRARAARANDTPWRKTNSSLFPRQNEKRQLEALRKGDISERQKGDIIAKC